MGSRLKSFSGFAFAAMACLAHASTTHQAKRVSMLQAPPSNGACLYFQLQGVAAADPAVNGNPFFAVPATHPGYREIYATLLAAKLSEIPVYVTATGALAGGACGSYVGSTSCS